MVRQTPDCVNTLCDRPEGDGESSLSDRQFQQSARFGFSTAGQIEKFIQLHAVNISTVMPYLLSIESNPSFFIDE